MAPRYEFFPHFLAEVSEQDLEATLDALAKCQTYSGKYYFRPVLMRNGGLEEVPFAEGFGVLTIAGDFGVTRPASRCA